MALQRSPVAQDTQFDLVLLDVMLPGINGIQVARRFRELRQDIAAQLKAEYARQRLRLLYYSAPGYESLAPSRLRTCSADAIRPSSESEDSFIFISKIREQPFISQ